MFMGLGKDGAGEAIAAFSEGAETEKLYIIAIMDETCVTISCRSDILTTSSNFCSRNIIVVVHKTALDSLYHSPLHATSTGDQVLLDVVSRNIRFPEISDIRVPIRSTITGDAIPKDETSASLLELVVDILLVHPVNWNLVTNNVVKRLPQNGHLGLLNVGPEFRLSQCTEFSLRLYVEPITIIGMVINMPGSPSVSKFCDVLEEGINTISKIPEHRFRVSDYSDGQNAKRAMKAHTCNFIEGADGFDNKFSQISPREAKSMDPQQRVLLRTAYEALEDSGYVLNSTPTTRPETFGCYIGIATHDYIQNLRNDIDSYYNPEAMALMNRDCDSALVGGVGIVTGPGVATRAEGCGVFVLKRLSDALAESDRTLGVIGGIEVNQSGLAHSITHPHGPTQAALFQRVLQNSSIDPAQVNIVEAHGTGTQAGDPNELDSIRNVFSLQRSADNPLHITSIKETPHVPAPKNSLPDIT
ncbi:hypothetical protein DXG01_006268 [Tephrocybe rancida]|nr:hypothetical protein DXG01_006268 [Tephrocybe rancida]